MSNEYKDYINDVRADLKKLLEDYNMSIELSDEDGYPVIVIYANGWEIMRSISHINSDDCKEIK